MTIVEKAAYLKGIADGIGMTADAKEGKLWTALNELLSSMAHEIEQLQSSHLDLADALDDLSDEVNLLSGADPAFFDPDEDLYDEDPLFGDDEELDEDEDEDEEDELLSARVLYDLTCPVCGGELTIDEQMLAEGSIECPGCGEALEFDFGDEDTEQ